MIKSTSIQYWRIYAQKKHIVPVANSSEPWKVRCAGPKLISLMIFFSARVLRKLHELEACEANSMQPKSRTPRARPRKRERRGKGRGGQGFEGALDAGHPQEYAQPCAAHCVHVVLPTAPCSGVCTFASAVLAPVSSRAFSRGERHPEVWTARVSFPVDCA